MVPENAAIKKFYDNLSCVMISNDKIWYLKKQWNVVSYGKILYHTKWYNILQYYKILYDNHNIIQKNELNHTILFQYHVTLSYYIIRYTLLYIWYYTLHAHNNIIYKCHI